RRSTARYRPAAALCLENSTDMNGSDWDRCRMQRRHRIQRHARRAKSHRFRKTDRWRACVAWDHYVAEIIGLGKILRGLMRSREHVGLDSIQNGIALSSTAHWMFDRGLIGLSDDLDILISRQVNDRASVEAIVNRTGKALVPEQPSMRPHPAFLGWHRRECFKQ